MARGFVTTPPDVVERIVSSLAPASCARRDLRILEPGCGTCTFLAPFATSYAKKAARDGFDASWLVSRIRGVEIDEGRASRARQQISEAAAKEGLALKARHLREIVVTGDFLEFDEGEWDVIVGNPPYVRLEGLTPAERKRHRAAFSSATQRYDLYFLFFEQSLKLLAPKGRLAFVTPQKYMRVWSGQQLRDLLASRRIEAIEILPEDAFQGRITYPAITRLVNAGPPAGHRIQIMDAGGNKRTVAQSKLGKEPWARIFSSQVRTAEGPVLRDVADSIGVGIATGADKVYELDAKAKDLLPDEFVQKTVSGRNLPESPDEPIKSWEYLVWPYDAAGQLVSWDALKERAPRVCRWLSVQRARLEKRSCVKHAGRDWYEFHERPRSRDYVRDKILVPDIQLDPTFRVDRDAYVPRHSVYYIVPKEGFDLDKLCKYLNSEDSANWLKTHCQPAAGGRIRVQSRVLAQLPVPDHLKPEEMTVDA